jgi:hypothetical protein
MKLTYFSIVLIFVAFRNVISFRRLPNSKRQFTFRRLIENVPDWIDNFDRLATPLGKLFGPAVPFAVAALALNYQSQSLGKELKATQEASKADLKASSDILGERLKATQEASKADLKASSDILGERLKATSDLLGERLKATSDLLGERLKATQDASKADVKLLTDDISRLEKLFDKMLKEKKLDG